MTDNGPTPGPWRPSLGPFCIEVFGAHGKPVAGILSGEPAAIADARMIAAAPEMLAALIQIRSVGILNPTGSQKVDDAAKAVSVAIMKATAP